MLGTKLSEYHSGYRAYSVKALASLPFEGNSDGFNFDTQIIIQLVDSGKRIREIPIPTYYGDEICYVNGLKYAKAVSLDVLRYRMSKVGFLSGEFISVGEEYRLKQAHDASHSVILRWLDQMPPARVLDLGCSSGLLSERIRALGHRVTGVDLKALPDVTDRTDRFVQADLDEGLPTGIDDEGPFDVVVAADVLEHVRDPDRLLGQIRSVLVQRGALIASVPNFGHWYPRARTAAGLFDYDQRGILDRGHIRFFTRRSILSMLRHTGFTVIRQHATGLPLEGLTKRDGPMLRAVRMIDRIADLACGPPSSAINSSFTARLGRRPTLLRRPLGKSQLVAGLFQRTE